MTDYEKCLDRLSLTADQLATMMDQLLIFILQK